MNLTKVLQKRASLIAEGNKLIAEGGRLFDEGRKLVDEGNKLRAEGHKVSVRTAHTRVIWYGHITNHWVKIVDSEACDGR